MSWERTTKPVGTGSKLAMFFASSRSVIPFPSSLLCLTADRCVLLFSMQTYWNGKYIDANVNVINNARTGLDVNPSIASIHLFDAEAGCDDVTFQPCSPKALASVKLFVDSYVSSLATPCFGEWT